MGGAVFAREWCQNSIQGGSQDAFKMGARFGSLRDPPGTSPRRPKTAPRGPGRLPRNSQEAPRGPQETPGGLPYANRLFTISLVFPPASRSLLLSFAMSHSTPLVPKADLFSRASRSHANTGLSWRRFSLGSGAKIRSRGGPKRVAHKAVP